MDENTLLAVAIILGEDSTRRERKKWMKKMYADRSSLSHTNLMEELRLEPSDWLNYMRMDESSYFWLLERVTPLIAHQNTELRTSISAHERLSATLRFIISGGTYSDLKFRTAISQPSLSNIIPETCRAINQVLKDYMKFPKSQNDWKTIAKAFNDRWQFPNCLGAVDGKHIRISPPPGSGSKYYNYKYYDSVVLMATADANYKFIMCDVGGCGSDSDGACIQATSFYKKLVDGKLHIPPEENVPNTTTSLPYVFIGDEAFALRKDFLKPFGKKQLNYQRKIFNYRLSRARRIVENVFGILASRFRIFHCPINLRNIDNINTFVLTCCYLHNFLTQSSSAYTIPDFDDDDEQNIFTEIDQCSFTNSLDEAKEVRIKFVEYFMNSGRVEWQDEAVERVYYS